MKSTSSISLRRAGCFRRSNRAFTLPEMMIVMTIFTLLFAVLVSSQVFGLHLKSISETKLAATAGGRKALNQVRTEVRASKILLIGMGNNTFFTSASGGAPQIGNALQISFTTNTGTFVRYYLDTNDNSLKRITSFDARPQTLASFITNRLVFQAEDFRGNVLTSGKNRLVQLLLEFYRREYPLATVGNGGMYDYYRLQTRITRRMAE